MFVSELFQELFFGFNAFEFLFHHKMKQVTVFVDKFASFLHYGLENSVELSFHSDQDWILIFDNEIDLS